MIVDEQQMRTMLEEMGVEQSKIDEFISQYPKNKEEEERDIKRLADQGITVQHLKEKYDKEEDWRKKAAIMAGIISEGL